MSDDIEEMLESKSKKRDKTFAEVEGLPANAHKRAKIKEEKTKSKTVKRKVFFTMNGKKFVRVDVKPNGAYQTYLGRLKSGLGHVEARAEKEHWELEKKKWAEKGPWLHEHEAQERIAEAIAELKKG